MIGVPFASAMMSECGSWQTAVWARAKTESRLVGVPKGLAVHDVLLDGCGEWVEGALVVGHLFLDFGGDEDFVPRLLDPGQVIKSR